jgi:antitoxin FitA
VQALLALLALIANLPDNCPVATIVIRNLDPAVKRRLQVRAALNGRSMEAEARSLLDESLHETQGTVNEVDIGTAIHRRFARFGGVDLKIPPRSFSHRRAPEFDE